MDTIYTVERRMIEEQGGLVEDSVIGAIKKYPNGMLERTAEEHRELLKKLLELNGSGNAFADLYFGRLQQAEQQRILEALTEEEQRVLLRHDTKSGIYFPLTPENLNLLAALSAREILFSTYYFTKYPCTIWGNYGLKYPVFYGSEEIQSLLKEIVEKT